MTKHKFLRSGIKDKKPLPEQLEIGNIAINFNDKNPFISFKSSSDRIVTIGEINGNIPTKLSQLENDTKFINLEEHNALKDSVIENYERIVNNANSIADVKDDVDKLKSQKYKTINNQSIFGEGNIEINGTEYDDTNLRELIAENALQIGLLDGQLDNKQDKGDYVLSSDLTGYTPIAKYTTLNGIVKNTTEQVATHENQLQNLLTNKQDNLVSGQNIKTINGYSLLGEGNIDINGKEGGGDYLPLTGGTLSGKIQIGDALKNNSIANAILHIRKVTNSVTGSLVNGACYSVNGDGTATLQHKTYNEDGTGAKNAAILRLSNQGLQFAINTGSSASPSEDMYKEIATQEYVDTIVGKINDILTSI